MRRYYFVIILAVTFLIKFLRLVVNLALLDIWNERVFFYFKIVLKLTGKSTVQRV